MIQIMGIILVICSIYLLGITVGYYAGKNDKK